MLFNTVLSEFVGFDPDSWLMYLMYGLIVGFVSIEALFYLVKSLKRAKEIGMDMGKIKKVITTSTTFSILPAVGIGIGVVTLIGALGIAFPSIRLSVVGALQYETQMADAGAQAITGKTNGMSVLIGQGITASDFVTMAMLMTISIVWGCLLIIIFYKRLQPKITKLGMMDLSTSGKGGNKFIEEQKINIGDICFQVAFIGMIIGYISMAISTIFDTTEISETAAQLASNGGISSYVDADGVTVWTMKNMYYSYGYYNLIAVIVAAISMLFFDILINKVGWKWLDSFATAFSMIIAMIVVGIIAYFAQQNNWDPTLIYAADVSNALALFI